MFSFPFDFGLPLAIATAVLGLCWGAGRLLVPDAVAGRAGLWPLALLTGWGLLFAAGVAATMVSARFCYGTLIPLLQLLLAGVWHWQRGRGRLPPVSASAPTSPALSLHEAAEEAGTAWASSRNVGLLGLAWVAWVFLTGWQYQWRLAEGLREFHGDLGYAVQLALGVPEAHASSHWAATLGAEAVAGAAAGDVWYHWAPVWLAAVLTKLTGQPAMALMYQVLVPVLGFELLLLASAVVQRLAGLRLLPSLLAGAASLAGVQWIKMFGVLWLSPWLPFGTLQHSRLSLLAHFPYQFEGMAILLALGAWQHRQAALAAVLLYFAGLSAPHNVAVMGVAAGTLLGTGVLLRRRELWRPALVMVLLLLAAWGTLKFLFHVDLPKAAGQALFVFDWRVLLGRFRAGLLDAGVGLLLEALLLPGLIHLVRQKERPEAAVLGWLALSALAGSYLAYHLLRHVSDNFHFTMLAHAVLVMPVSLWGLACLWRKSTALGRRGPALAWAAVIALSLLMGLHDLWQARKSEKALPYAVAEISAVKAALAGRPFGYFATSDRQWWISKHSTLASYLNARCVRLNTIPAVDGDRHSQYYGAARPRELVPERPGEPPPAWSLRLAKRLQVRHVLETEKDPLPAELKSQARLLSDGASLRLYEIVPSR